MVELARDEMEMLDGKQGRAKQRAMEILIQYADALGAERFVSTNNVHILIGFYPYPEVVDILDGRKVHPNVTSWIWTAYQLKTLADRSGYTDIILKAGAQIMTDTCPLNPNLFPEGTKIVATDSAKQAHYTPAITGFDAWFGTMEECIDAAVTGKWRGELK